MTSLKFTTWALEQVKNRGPGSELAQMNLQALVDALNALRGKAGAQVFGMGADRIEPEGRPELEQAVIAQLIAWKRHFEAENNAVAELSLDAVGTSLGIDALKLTRRVALQCDPLGTRDGLSKEWLSILARLDDAKAGTRALQLEAVQVVGEPCVFGAADQQALYETALRYEARMGQAFPRELAAFWATANGIIVGDTQLLAPIADWSDEEDGLRIGSGGYMQGSLVLKKPGKKPLAAKLIDADDDGVERAKYSNFAAFADALLG